MNIASVIIYPLMLSLIIPGNCVFERELKVPSDVVMLEVVRDIETGKVRDGIDFASNSNGETYESILESESEDIIDSIVIENRPDKKGESVNVERLTESISEISTLKQDVGQKQTTIEREVSTSVVRPANLEDNNIIADKSAVADIPVPVGNYSYDVYKKSGFTTHDYDKILRGTPMNGFGKYISQMENTYEVSGFFCLGVARAESSLGDSEIARTKNNFFGIKNMFGSKSFDSPEDCIMYFGDLMTHSIYYGKTIDEIGPIYCDADWPSLVKQCMLTNYNIFAA